jgi:soluble lytic murein transglycosylase-like protein
MRLIPCAAAACVVLALPAAAHADIVKLTNGRIMNVEMAHFDGDMVILDMRGGGEIRAPRNMIAELLPDEVPYARSVAIEALAASPMATAAPMSVDAIRALVRRIAAKVGLDERLAHAVVKVESNYQMLAVSSRGAMGLMQIMPATARQYGVVDPFNPEQNIEAGVRLLKDLQSRYGRDTRRVLAAYNAGEGAVTKYGGVPPYRETQMYVSKIMTMLR